MTCLVQDAITARLPLIVVTSLDPFYDTAIIRHMAGIAKRFVPVNHVASTDKLLSDELVGKITNQKQANAQGNKVICFTGEIKDIAWKDIYQTASEKKSTVVVILRNGEEFNLGYQAGTLNPPEDMVFDILKPFCDDIFIPESQKALQGLQLTDIESVLRLTKARDGQINAQGIRETRKAFVGGVRGLTLIETEQAYYLPDQPVVDWYNVNAGVFLKSQNARLVPRGILFEGVAGTGKSSGAKYIAHQLGLQLVKVDFGSMMSKWSGEAETNLERALATLDQMAPCVALFDEIEKAVTTESDDGGSARRMLAKLLWWLQEHRSKVLTVMTTNDLPSLPQELYRAGRIDEVLNLDGMTNTPDNLATFLKGLEQPFIAEGLKVPTFANMQAEMVPMSYTVVDNKKDRNGMTFIAQAEITATFIKQVKKLNFEV